MSSVRAWIDRHSVLVFALVACVFSWSLWALMLRYLGRIHWLAAFGPSLAAVLIVAITRGRSGLGALLRPLGRWRFGILWYALILLGSILVMLLGVWIYSRFAVRVVLPREIVLGVLRQILPYLPLILLIGGPLGEEIGWRGFLLPHFLERRSPLISSLLVALFWFVWRLPLLLLPGTDQPVLGVVSNALFIAGWSVLFTWIYLGTKRSLLAMLLLYTCINTFQLFMSGAATAEPNLLMLGYAVAAALAAINVAAIDKRMTEKPGAAAK